MRRNNFASSLQRLLALGLPMLATALVDVNGRQCRCLPGDACWPASDAWASLNETVDGRLIADVPIGSPCHDPNYDALACENLKANWLEVAPHIADPSSFLQVFFANQSCDPFTPTDEPCRQGNYAVYTVNVSTTDHVAAAIRFARDKNIRLTIKNTGHDYFGRSTGAGALAIWTHNLKDIEVLDSYDEPYYAGPAVKVGAGVQGFELLEALDPLGLVAVSGECPSVALGGGFIQGGGHSMLSTAFGMAADQALEYEVVTAAGKVVRASPKEHADLYWALSGGGGGTYGVVTSVIVRAHAVESVGGGSIRFLAASTTKETYAALATRLLELLPGMVDQGATVNYIFNPALFSVSPFTVVNATGDFVRDTVAAELVQAVRDAGVPAAIEFSTLSYRDHFNKYLGPLPYGTLTTSDWQIGGRLIGRRDLEENTDTLTSLLTSYVADGVTLVGTAGNFTASGNAVAPNAVNPRWRDAIIQQQLLTPWSTDPSAWEAMIDAQHVITDKYVAGLKAETPNGGTYVNEADFREPDWQAEFFGGNYKALLLAKRKWDPEGLFYGLKLVGSDAWSVDQDGRMCRAGP